MAKLMPLLPASTNHAYTGMAIAPWGLSMFALLTLVPGCIHTFLPDGGANLIAGLGLDLASEHGRRAVGLFAWAGATQIVWGLMLLVISLRYRPLVPLAFALLAFERILHAVNMWGPKGGADHPPEAYATLVMIPILMLGAVLALRET